jgi:hypothetical protein
MNHRPTDFIKVPSPALKILSEEVDATPPSVLPIAGNPWLFVVTLTDDEGAPTTIVINRATGDGAWFDEDVYPILRRRIRRDPLISTRMREKLNAAYLTITGRNLRF